MISTGFPADQISPEQAPPLSLPFLFFMLGTLSIIAAGIGMFLSHETLFFSNWVHVTLGFTHFGTLGFLGSIMMGAFYQMTPVVAGKPIPFIKTGYLILFLHTVGTTLIIVGLMDFSQPLIKFALFFEGTALSFFLLTALMAIFTAPTKHASVTGMRIALVALLLTGVLGIFLGMVHLGIPYPGIRNIWLQTHITFGVLGWIGTLIMAVSWQVIPMFYMTPHYRQKSIKIMVSAQALLLFFLLISFFLSIRFKWYLGTHLSSWGCIVIVWLIHPLTSLSLISKRRRKNRDGSLLFWKMGLLTALACVPVTATAFFSSTSFLPLLAGWIALWGWAGSIVHGMLYRIIPFLIWFHKFSALVGIKMVPSMKSLLPEKQVTHGLVLHFLTLLLGCAAIIFNHKILIMATATGLITTGLVLLRNFIMALVIAHRAVKTTDR